MGIKYGKKWDFFFLQKGVDQAQPFPTLESAAVLIVFQVADGYFLLVLLLYYTFLHSH